MTMQLRMMNDALRKTLNLAWLPMTGTWLVDQLFAKPDRFTALRTMARGTRHQDADPPQGSPFTISDVPLLDEAMELLGPDPRPWPGKRHWTPNAPKKSSSPKTRSPKPASGRASNASHLWSTTSTAWMRNSPPACAGADREWTYRHVVVVRRGAHRHGWRMLIAAVHPAPSPSWETSPRLRPGRYQFPGDA